MCVIGLTGSLGAGKSTVAAMFAELGAKVLDADKIAHRQICPGGPCFRPVVEAFGKDILTAGKIDRKKVARRVFRDPRQLRKLERIVHPAVRRAIVAEVKRYKQRKRKMVVVIDVPLLFESGLHRHVDIAVVVKTGRAVQMARAVKLLGITKAEAARRLRRQMPLRQKIRLADMTIDNNGTFKQTQQQVKQIWEKL